MSTKEITSLHHPLVKDLVKLRTDKEERKRKRLLLVSGKKMILDLAKNCRIEALLESDKELDIQVKTRYKVSFPILKKITALESPDGYAAVLPFPKELLLKDQKYLLVLNGLSDPGNVGTLFRTALGLGWEGVIVTPGTVDPFNDKALRAGKGAQLHLPFWERSIDEILKLKRHLYTADSKGKELKSFQTPLILILGNESQGVGASFIKSANLVSIPMTKEIDSYNVAIAGSILMYQIKL